jgi:excinuclease ABC subunit A
MKCAMACEPVATCSDPDADVNWLVVRGAVHNNLKGIDVHIPLGRFVCVTGVSGSGKSSLVNDILWPALARRLNEAEPPPPGRHRDIVGTQHLDKVIDIDQSPIGRTPRSNPATYIKVFDEIRNLYAKLPDSKVRGYQPGRFSFNVKTGEAGGGRCEACEGNGANKMEMDFLADIWVTCPVCGGRRFSRETLQVLFKGKSIADVLEMDVQQALEHFANIPKIAAMLQTLHDVGMDYIKLGQSSTTLSGGEAQRIKLARELVKRSTGRTLYLLDEPTTGLHFDDIRKLLKVLHGFVDAGNTVLVIEHNLDVVKTADWIIDLGPEGGEAGGCIVAEGTPEQVAAVGASYTGQALRAVLGLAERRSDGSTKRRRGESLAAGRSVAGGVRGAFGTTEERKNGLTDAVTVVGAREHNLKDITVTFPRGQTTVCTGVSGSGKSSFALDTVYAEGQRRYVESLSAYARQFLGQLAKPRVDRVHGLSPAISIEQKAASKSPRSTVGTVTEIYDYLRILWARLGRPYCPKCNIPIGTQTSDEIISRVMEWPDGSRLLLCAPVERTGSETWRQLFERERNNGFARVRVDGRLHDLANPPEVDARQRHDVQIVVDRVVVRSGARSRIADSVEQALSLGDGWIVVAEASDEATEQTLPVRSATPLPPSLMKGGKLRDSPTETRFSQHRSCTKCGTSYEDLTPHHFSFNSRLGWCPTCEGLGTQQGTSADAIVVAPGKNILEGAIAGWEMLDDKAELLTLIRTVARHAGFDPKTPWNRLPASGQRAILYGLGDAWLEADCLGRGVRVQWKGFFPAIDEATRSSWQYRHRLSHLMGEVPCRRCHGGRLREDATAVRLGDKTLFDVCSMSLGDVYRFFTSLHLDRREKQIAGEVLHEVTSRLKFLVDVGLDYVTLHRTAPTLSGGESQRIRLASQIGSGLTGVLYVLDEPTIGLHPRDNLRLINALRHLRDLGNTLLMVEHDREVIEHADHVLDFGPGAGADGGRIVAEGPPAKVRRAKASLTGQYLSGAAAIPVPTNRRKGNGKTLAVLGARHNNLKNIDVDLPLGTFIAITGVSGSGKSSLVNDVLYAALARRLHHVQTTPGGYDDIRGIEHIDKVINVDQSPIGITPTSNPATYTGVFDIIRELFSKLPESKVRGYTANRFSFNRPGGRCEVCEGNGQRCVEMHFLPDVWVTCEECGGARYNRETLEVRYKGKSIADVLNMRVREALEHFANVPKLKRMLETLADVGLDYVQLGQPAHTLSGGEAQRVKLAAELGRPYTGQTLYVLDEPTTGLHFDDLRKLLAVLHRLVDLGNTVVCIEHNLDVIKTADRIIDLGPEGGDAGGEIVAEGTPERVAANKRSATGRILADVLAAGPREERKVYDASAAAATAALLERPLKVVELGEHAALPWERNGQAWHTRDRVGRRGEKIRWEGEALLWLVEQIQRAGRGGFAETDWNNRSHVEIRSPNSSLPWFFHALTGGEWLLDVTLRVPANTFKSSELVRLIGLKKLDDRPELPIYGQWQRVRIHRPNRQWDCIRLQIHDREEIDTPGMRQVIRTSAGAYLKAARKAQDSPSELQPWKEDGRAWHLSQKSIPPHHLKQWQPPTLVELLGHIGKLVPGMRVDWSNKVSLRLTAPGSKSFHIRVGTSHAYGLRMGVLCPAGMMTPARVDKLGIQPEVTRRNKDFDVVSFWVQNMGHVDAGQFAGLIRSAAGEAQDGSLTTAAGEDA